MYGSSLHFFHNFFKPSHVCALLCLALYFSFKQCQQQHCTWYSAPRKELCPCAEPVELTTAHPESRCSLRCSPLEQWDVQWRQTEAQLGFVGCPKSRSLVFFLSGRTCPAWDSCNVFYDWGDTSMKHCIQKSQVFSGLCILMEMQPSHDLLVTWQWYHRAYRAIHSQPPLVHSEGIPRTWKVLKSLRDWELWKTLEAGNADLSIRWNKMFSVVIA